MRVGPVGIVNGTFGNRPHCIYRGFCLQGCKVNAKASPYVTHLPDALAHGVEIRANSMAVRRRARRGDGRATGVSYVREGDEHRAPPARPRSWLSPATRSRRRGCCCTRPPSAFPNGIGNNEDQVGRYVMVQGASQTAGRFPEELRMYKGPPPEVSSEQFYETDQSRGLRPRVLDPDGLAAADRLGRARPRRRPLGPRDCASTCATTTTGPRSACSTSCSPTPRTG